MTKPKKATIHDIAAKVGTSAASVSRVLSNSGYPVSAELKGKILQTAKNYHYIPNMVGRMLKKSRSYDIGLVIPAITNPFYAQVVMGAEIEARKSGYNILICNTMRDPCIEKQSLESLIQKQVAGIILSSVKEEINIIKSIRENGSELVMLDKSDERIECSNIRFDYRKGAISAIDFLVDMGHNKIAFISSPLTKKSRREVFEGYKAGLAKHGIEAQSSMVFISESEKETSQGTYEYNNGIMLTEKVLKMKDKPTAIFAVNDMTAYGVVKKLKDSGLKVPEDISVSGFDNIEFSSIISPSLTTIEQPSFETGKIACKLLLDQIEEGTSSISMSFEPKLVIRESVRNIRISNKT